MSGVAARRPAEDYEGKEPTWCPGCGDFGVLRALATACAALGLEKKDIVLVTGIGCSGNMSAYLSTYGMHGLHGRALPLATGVKVANPSLTVVAAGGDGDGYGIGLGHVLHAARRNADITYLVMDNQVYGLTKGQASPTTGAGLKTKGSPLGPLAEPVEPLELALAAGATFVAQGFSGQPAHLAGILEGALRHPGFALVNVKSPCVTFNPHNTYAWYRERAVDVGVEGHDPTDREAALRAVRRSGRVPTGILYRARRPTLCEVLASLARDEEARGPIEAAADPAGALAASRARFGAWLDDLSAR